MDIARDGGVSPPAADSAPALPQAIAAVSLAFDVPDSLLHRPGVAPAAEAIAEGTSIALLARDGEPSWDIEVEDYVTEDRVSRFVERFLTGSRRTFVGRLQRGKRYEPMIRRTLREAGIPEDMYFLALVESGFDPDAYSRAAAVGMWQFMTSTARVMGLRVDWWVDERRDPVKSTAAAARFIRDLREQFGSLYLAAAAYNGGPGRVSRGLRKYDDAMDEVSGEDRFFALAERDYLRLETKNYVPQLIAAALIGKAPGRFGITLDSVAPFAYDSVVVPPATPLRAIARASGRSVAEIQALNPHVLRGVTAPDSAMLVRIPPAAGAAFDSAFRALPDEERHAFRRVTARRRESVAAFARREGIPLRVVQGYNPSLRGRRPQLAPGREVLIPSAGVLEGARSVPDPAIERYGRAGRASGGRTVHVVRRGETLGGIAKRYGTSTATLLRLNRLKRPLIVAGQTIIVRGPAASASRRPGAKAAAGRRSVRAPAPNARTGKASRGATGRGKAPKTKAGAKTTSSRASRG